MDLYRLPGPLGTSAPRTRHAACWAHARRKLFDEFERTKSPIAEEALRRIAKLYEIEADIIGHSAALRQKARKDLAVPILDEMKTWFHDQRRQLSSKSNRVKALQYALTRWEALALYTTDSRIGINNKPAEQSLRGIAVTRKNFLFRDSDAGGERAAVLHTFLKTAKLNGLNPEVHLDNIIDRTAKGHPINRLNELLPWHWNKQVEDLAA